MNYRVNQTVILDNECVRIIEVDEKRNKYKGRDEETYEIIVFSESSITVSY